MIQIVIETVRPKCCRRRRRVDVYIAEIIVEDVNCMRCWTNWTIINSIVEATGFQFGKNFGKESWFGIDAQHTRTQTIQKEKTTVKETNS